VRIQEESKTLASITFQNYFRFYTKLSGMTGTADTSAEEFFKVYSLTVTTIPTHREVRRVDHNDLIFQTEIGKFRAMTKKVKELQEKGQPVLVGTASIEKNEILSEYFKRAGIKHEVLNAKNHEREAEIIAQAGRKGSVVIATNMAGRGVDIKLGGLPVTPELHEEVRSLGGLYVIGTERHEARRIDNQLRGRSGRQGDPGETQFYVSLEDSLMRVFASDTIRSMMGKFGIPEDEPINSKLVSRSLESAQTKIEGMHFDSRKHVLDFDDVLNTQRKSIYEKRSRLLQEDKEYLNTVIEDLKNFEEGSREMIEKKMAAFGEADISNAIRIVTLQTIDQLWVDHLEAMEYLRNSVSLRSYGQRDPLVEYKKEGLQMFRGFEHRLRGIVHGFLANLDEKTAVVAPKEKQVVEGFEGEEQKPKPQTSGAKSAGRNEPCPCGRGKKVKKCDCTEYAHLR
jgi:preprotein translocase subunit SecA